MGRRLNITAARNRLLSLPEELAPGESIEVVRHKKTVLRIVRPQEGEGKDPFALMDREAGRLPRPKRRPPRDLSARYKEYLYGKKG